MPLNPSLARVAASLFVVSALFPITAGLLNLATPPRWLGTADVTVAAMLAVVALLLVTRGPQPSDRDLAAGFRILRAAADAIPVLLVVFFVAGHRVNWEVLVIGLAWRAWLLVYVAAHLAAARPRRA